ncbi:MAG: hypothetical protein Pg6A_12310 [Termitinemataceae bacterium]|nr:MAG: hypothetical protein Pg6A_12310 [Termitinemataceae bacterium]
MARQSLKQTAKGNFNQQAGGNIYNYPPTKMRALIEAYEHERLANATFNAIIEQLDYYLNPINGESGEVIGLEKKLQIGHFDEFISYAMIAKDMFARKLEQHRFSKVAQEIFLYVLADIWTMFHQKVYQPICDNEAHGMIMQKIQNEIIEVISKRLEDNVLDIDSGCISGMIYFLTGNCHIKWSKE